MLWFNAAKDLGALHTEEGESLDVPGEAFAPSQKPNGRCAGMVVEFDWDDGRVTGIAFVEELSPRRARLRRHR
jgi:hypothetical protein